MTKKAVVVTTKHRGVFFGFADESKLEDDPLKLYECRMCIYWPKELRGVVGLAASGPMNGSRVSPAAPSMILKDITGIMECSDIAVESWESEPWI